VDPDIKQICQNFGGIFVGKYYSDQEDFSATGNVIDNDEDVIDNEEVENIE